jgi:hypothetical protein
MRPKPDKSRAAKVVAPAPRQPAPAWLKPALLALATLLLLTWFTGEISDTDFWHHLLTGKLTLKNHALTYPDPFSYTSNMYSPEFPGEARTRYFNLTHEWLAEVAMYAIYVAAGLPGLVLARALLLLVFCGLAGLMVWWRCGGFYRSLAAAIAAGGVAINFQQSRPFLATFLFLAITMAICERRRWLWALPAVFLIWANCHGGYFVGWAMLGAYCVDGLLRRPPVFDRKLWIVSAVSFLVSGLNPNGFRVIEIMMRYRSSPIQASVLEWQYTAFWEPSGYSLVLFGALAMLWISRRQTRPVDWILYFAFAAASILAVRNTILLGLVGAVVMFALVPLVKRPLPVAAEYGAAALIAVGALYGIASGRAFQLHAADWMLPTGAADFLQAHSVTGRMFNTYENGSYLVWRLWPMQKDFVDPRGLSEEAWADSRRVLVNDPTPGHTFADISSKYGFEVMVVSGFDRYSGTVYNIAAALADPSQKEWKLVQSDEKGVVFMRRPPPGVTPLNSLEALHSIELQCQQQVLHDPRHSACLDGVTNLYKAIGDPNLAARWMAYLNSRR